MMTTDNRVFTNGQRELLSRVLDRLIPPEGPLPGAGELGVNQFIEGVLAKQVQLRRLFINGLAQIEIAASSRQTEGYFGLTDDGKDAVLKGVESSHPEFFEELVRQSYSGYYTSPTIFQQLGYEEPPAEAGEKQPELLDESLLEQQRQRAPFWRRV